MIIRRRHNGNFTTIGNDAINDDRLSFEALGLLAYLISKPDDWQVRLAQLRVRANVGRDKLRRILSELVKCGYVLRKKIRDAAGAFVGDEFEVYDRPQIVDDPDIDRTGVNLGDGDPAPENPALDEPAPGYPAPGYPAPENTSLAIYKDSPKTEELPKTDSYQTERERARDPEKTPPADPWAEHPEDDPRLAELIRKNPGIDDPVCCAGVWSRMSEERRKLAFERHEATLARHHAEAGRTKPFKLQTYLRNGLFDQVETPRDGQPALTIAKARSAEYWWLLYDRVSRGRSMGATVSLTRQHGTGITLPHAELPGAEALKALVPIETGSEQFEAWRKWFAARGVRFSEHDPHVCGKFIYLPSEWPPGHGQISVEDEIARGAGGWG